MDRSKYYKEPLKLGAQTIYLSNLLNKLDEQHWEQFHLAVTSGKGFKVGDFIDLSVRLSAQQIVKFLDEIKKVKTIEEVHAIADDVILDIAKEIQLPDNKLPKNEETA
jgi:hypothetical protein